MALYVLDTGILLGYARAAPFAEFVETRYAPTKTPNAACVCVVSLGEIRCFPIRGKCSDKKRENLETVLRQTPVADIHHRSVLDRYAEIATYCQGANPQKPLPNGVSAHALRDNDLWIAATASVVRATLITTDKNFLFLDNVFLNVVQVDPKQRP